MSPNKIEHNADELEAPAWLDIEYFTKVLQQIEKNVRIKIENLKLTPATAKGDHFASIMFRALVDYKANQESRSKSLILKTMPEMEGHKKDVLKESHIFETEIGMYTKVVPKFKEILKEIGDTELTLGATCLYYSLTPKKVIIFEDAVPLGYQVERNQKALSLNVLKVAYEKLAKWHALSHKILKEQPDFLHSYRYGIFNMKTFYESEKIKNSIHYFVEMLSEHEDLLVYKKYFEALSQRKNLLMNAVKFYDEFRCNPQNSTFYVLCHGDFHYKNMMFKRSEDNGNGNGGLLDLMLLDFQLCYVGPAVNDLIYSSYMLLNGEQRSKYFDELVYYYYMKLKETLIKIGFKGSIPKLIDLKCQLMRYKDLDLFLLTTFLPFWHAMNDPNFEADKMANKADRQRILYNNPTYLKEVREILPKYLNLGYFD